MIAAALFVSESDRPTDQLLISADEGRREREEWREMVWLAAMMAETAAEIKERKGSLWLA